jgi:dTDP-4-dehydrorhamnose reductase
MKIGLIGHRGFLGTEFLKLIQENDEVICFNRGDQFKVLEDCEIIINANGNASKILAESDPIQDFNSNSTFALELSLLSKKIDALLVHISSGEALAFSRSNSQGSNPINSLVQLSNYGLSKAIGEILVKKHSSKSLVIRPAGLVGPGMTKGPIFDILKGKPLWIHPKSTLNIMRTVTTARFVLDLARQHLQENWTHQEFNLTGESTVSLFEASKILSKELFFDENLPVYHSLIDVNANVKSISLPTSQSELMAFHIETLKL